MASLQEFMSWVVPWPQAGDHGVVNIHWTVPDQKGMRGKPFSQLADFLSFVRWANAHTKFVKDIYFCLSMQSEVGKLSAAGKATAKRIAENAVALTSIWIDSDIKEKGYKTLEELLNALQKFITDARLPPPSALIHSGGGVHVYWISDHPLTVDEWRLYAYGLKDAALEHGFICDYGVTTDEARILRIPGTWNHKTVPPKPVRLLQLGTRYNFKTSLEAIRAVSAVAKRVTMPPTTLPSFVLRGKPAAAFAGLTPERFEGIGYTDAPLDWKPLKDECGFFADALKTGGAKYSQPMWNLSTLMATFLGDGYALAHIMGDKHPGYSKETTDALWDRKLAERKDRGLGWPSCNAIQAAGCTRCAACPHFGQIKSPLNLTATYVPPEVQPNVLAVPLGGGTAVIIAPPNIEAVARKKAALPPGYEYIAASHETGKIIEKDLGGGRMRPEFVKIFLTDIDLSNAWVEREPEKILHFHAETTKGIVEEITVKQADLATLPTLTHSLTLQGILFTNPSLLGDFFMFTLQKLHNAVAALRSVSFGWFEEDGAEAGFAYGGRLYLRGGTDTVCSMGDPETRKIYTPCGSIEPWFDCLKLVTSQKRPELEVITAAAFAAPLMHLTGQPNGTLSIFGDPGAGKSTALEVGAAVWGHRKLSKQQPDVSKKSLLEKMGQLCNLPIYWDDIRDYQMEKTGETLTSVSHGAEGGTLTRDRHQRRTGSWESILVVTSNYSMVDYMLKKNKNDAATLYRTFEFQVTKEADPTDMPTYEADRLMMKLANNFGNMGVRYAQLLASDPVWVAKEMATVEKEFAEAVKQKQEERFWLSLCVGILTGAKLAALVGVNFNIPAMRKFLMEVYVKQRDRVKVEAAIGGSEDHTRITLVSFVKSCSDNTLRTDKMLAVGSPGKSSVHMISHPHNQGNPIHVNWVMSQNTLRISKEAFLLFLDKRGVSPTVTLRGLREYYGMKTKPCNLAGGTPFNGGTEPCLWMTFEPGSWMYEWAHAYENDQTEEAALPAAPTVDSGLAATH